MRVRTLAVVTAAVLTLPVLAPAQSLGEAAAREKARREKQKTAPAPTKVITDEDLQKARGRGLSEFVTSSTTGGTAAPAAPGAAGKPVPGTGGTAAPAAAPEKTEDELRAEAQAAWREQMTAAQGDVARMQAEVDRLQGVLADNTASMYGSGRASAVARLEEAKKVLADAQARVTSLQDQGRRSGYR